MQAFNREKTMELETNKEIKVLVGVPVSELYDYCFDEFIHGLKSLTYKNKDVLLIDTSRNENYYKRFEREGLKVIRIPYHRKTRERVTRAHNLLRKEVLEKGYDYLLNLDQDVIPPADAIERLSSHKKKIVMGLYFGHHFVEQLNEQRIMPFAWNFTENKNEFGDVRYINPEETFEPGLIKIAFTGAGCMFIHRSVLERIKFRYDDKYDAWDDRWFGFDAYEKGFTVYLDNTVKCRHLYIKRPFKWKDIKKNREDF